MLEFRKWLRLSKADLDYITKQQLAGKSTVFDRYSYAITDLVCHCNMCQNVYFVNDDTPHADRDIEDTERFELADPNSFHNIWEAVVKHRYQARPARTDAESFKIRYSTKLPYTTSCARS